MPLALEGTGLAVCSRCGVERWRGELAFVASPSGVSSVLVCAEGKGCRS